MDDRPDLRRLQPLTANVGTDRVTVRVDRLHYGTDPLHDAIHLVRRTLRSTRPGSVAAPDLTLTEVQLGRRVGFDGRPLPEPRGAVTGLDPGGSGGWMVPSANPLRASA